MVEAPSLSRPCRQVIDLNNDINFDKVVLLRQKSTSVLAMWSILSIGDKDHFLLINSIKDLISFEKVASLRQKRVLSMCFINFC